MRRLTLPALFTAIFLACNITTPPGPGNSPAATQEGTVLPAETAESSLAGPVSVWVYFTMAADVNMIPIPIARMVPYSDDLATLAYSTIKELMKGPTDAEKATGLNSWFSPATANAATGVYVDGSELTVDFIGLRTLIPNASTSAGSQMLLSQLDSTLFQFDAVQTVHYTLDGDCSIFWEWLQSDCHPVTRAEWEAG